jgi:hypothetical protein
MDVKKSSRIIKQRFIKTQSSSILTHLYVAAVPDDASSTYDAVFANVDVGIDHGSVNHASLS